MATQRSTGDAEGVLYGCGELRPRWSRAEAIGLGGRWSGAALYAESRGVGSCVGGFLVRSENDRVQSELGHFQARWGLRWARGYWATGPSSWQHVAVQVLVQSEAGRRAGARERTARSARAGWHGDVPWAWSR
jgi:hypothetical protein